MDPQDDLFLAVVPSVKSAASREAAIAVKARTLGDRRRAVLTVLVAAGTAGLARYEIAATMGVPDHYISSSVAALKRNGEVAETDRRVRNPASGKGASVLVALSSFRKCG